MADTNPEYPTIIGPDASFKGELTFEKGLRLQGKFDGQINTQGRLLVAKEARMHALGLLAQSRDAPLDHPTLEQLGGVVGGWSLVHGYTMLLLDGRLKAVLHIAPEGTTPEALFNAMLASVDREDIGPRTHATPLA